MKVGHHGSKHSSSMSFLEEIKPQISIISCGGKLVLKIIGMRTSEDVRPGRENEKWLNVFFMK